MAPVLSVCASILSLTLSESSVDVYLTLDWDFPPVSSLLPPALYEKAEIKAPEEKVAKHLIIGVTSDRGLCGAIHSGVAKSIKSKIASLTSAGNEVMVVNVGDKLRGLLHR